MAAHKLTIDQLITKLKKAMVEERQGIEHYRKLAKDVYNSFEPSPIRNEIIDDIEYIKRDEEKHLTFLRGSLNKLIRIKRRK